MLNPPAPPRHVETNKEFHDLLVSNRLVEMRSFLENPPEGFDLDGPVKAQEGTTGLQYAVLQLFPEMVDLLLEFGADPNAGDRLDQTAMHAAACMSHDEFFIPLAKRGGRVDLHSTNGSTPFSLADVHNLDGLRILLNLGSQPDETDCEKKFTNLHRTGVHDELKGARILLEAGADPYALTTEGKLPSELGMLNKETETRTLIKQYQRLSRMEEDRDYSLEKLLAGDVGARMIDNPYNWRHGIPEQLERLAQAGQHLSREAWLKQEDALDGKSLADVALAARQGEAVLKSCAAQGEPLTADDILHEGALTPLGETMAQFGQLKALFEIDHAVEFSPQDLHRVHGLAPEESTLDINMHSLVAEVKRQQRSLHQAGGRGA